MTEQLKIDVVLQNFASKELKTLDRDISRFSTVNTKAIGKLGAAFTGVNAALGAAGSGLLKLGGQAGTAINALGEVSTAFALGGPLVAGVAAGIGILAAGFVSYQHSIENATIATDSYKHRLDDLKSAAAATKDLAGSQEKGLTRLQATLDVLNKQKGNLGLTSLQEQELAFKELSSAVETHRQSLIDLEIINKRFPEGSIETLRTYFDTKETLTALVELQKQYAPALKLAQEENKKGAEAAKGFNSELERQNQQLLKLSQQKNAFDGLKAGFNDLQRASQNWGDAARGAVNSIADSLTTNLSDAIIEVANKTKTAKDAFRDFGRETLKDIQRVLVEMLVLNVVQGLLGGIFGGGGGGGGFGGGGGSYGESEARAYALNKYGGRTGFRNGGVVDGPLEPVLGHAAKGMVVSRPGLYEIGEGGQREAIVPMVGNRAIPVQWVGGRGGGGGGGPGGGRAIVQNFTFNYSFASPSDEDRFIARNRQKIVAAVIEANNSSLSAREGLS